MCLLQDLFTLFLAGVRRHVQLNMADIDAALAHEARLVLLVIRLQVGVGQFWQVGHGGVRVTQQILGAGLFGHVKLFLAFVVPGLHVAIIYAGTVIVLVGPVGMRADSAGVGKSSAKLINNRLGDAGR